MQSRCVSVCPCLTVLQAAVGTHRIGAAEITAGLLSGGAPAIDTLAIQAGVLPPIVQLALNRPYNNALHCIVVQLLRSALFSSATELWEPLLARQGFSGVGSPLHAQLANIGTFLEFMCGKALNLHILQR